MNETERIVEVTVQNVRTPITWHEDPTRHLLEIKAVNAQSDSCADAQPAQPDMPAKEKPNKNVGTD